MHRCRGAFGAEPRHVGNEERPKRDVRGMLGGRHGLAPRCCVPNTVRRRIGENWALSPEVRRHPGVPEASTSRERPCAVECVGPQKRPPASTLRSSQAAPLGAWRCPWTRWFPIGLWLQGPQRPRNMRLVAGVGIRDRRGDGSSAARPDGQRSKSYSRGRRPVGPDGSASRDSSSTGSLSRCRATIVRHPSAPDDKH